MKRGGQGKLLPEAVQWTQEWAVGRTAESARRGQANRRAGNHTFRQNFYQGANNTVLVQGGIKKHEGKKEEGTQPSGECAWLREVQ